MKAFTGLTLVKGSILSLCSIASFCFYVLDNLERIAHFIADRDAITLFLDR